MYFARRSSLVIFGLGPFFPLRRGADASPPDGDAALAPPTPFPSRSFFACFAALHRLGSGGEEQVGGNASSALADGTRPAAERCGSWDRPQLWALPQPLNYTRVSHGTAAVPGKYATVEDSRRQQRRLVRCFTFFSLSCSGLMLELGLFRLETSSLRSCRDSSTGTARWCLGAICVCGELRMGFHSKLPRFFPGEESSRAPSHGSV